MLKCIANTIGILALVFAAMIFCVAQSADNSSSVFSKPEDNSLNRSKGFLESLQKMRIEKEKKEYDEMIDRGEQALKISEQLETTVSATGRLTEKELSQVAELEKLARKIRGGLGGDDDTEDKNEALAQIRTMSLENAVRELRDSTGTLYEELKKTTRFTISAMAIQSSNTVIRLAKALRIQK